MNCFTPMCDEMRDYCDGEWVCYSCDKMGFNPDYDDWDADDNYNADGTKTKTILGMTGLAVAIGLWKGNEIIAFIDKIKNAMK